MNNTRAANSVVVSLDGKGVTGRAGTLVVAELADRLGLMKALSMEMAPSVQRSRRRDPGAVLTHLATLLVDGGDCLSDLAALRNEPDLFGLVASDATAYRILGSGWASDAIINARASARTNAWAAGAAPESVTFDIDAHCSTLTRTRKRRPRTTRAGSGTTRSVAFSTRPTRPWPERCVRATPGPTTPMTTWRCSLRRFVSSREPGE